MKQFTARFRASLLALSLLLSLAACDGRSMTASAMHLRRTEGTVSVSNGEGKSLPALDNLGLYSGYGVGTNSASYAWIDLDDVKLAKMDQNSEIAIRKEGKALDIEVKSGSLFFNVTEPLEDDETMNIRTSTMLVGIRGTCGWVTANDGLSQVYLLEGKVECSAEGQTVRVNAGEMAELTEDGDLTVQEFPKQDIPAFVRDEADPDLTGADETPGPNGSETPAVSDTPEPTPAPTETPSRPDKEVVASGEAGENVTWTYYSDGTLTVNGTGNMAGYSYEGAPWFRYHAKIHAVMIDDGVTSIGEQAFGNCGGLTSVTIPGSVTSIERGAFVGCSRLIDVYYSDSESQWGQIDVGDLNDALLNATIHFNSAGIAAGINWNGHIYLVYDISVTWEEAKAYCENMGGHLATITSREEQAVINDLLDGQCSKNGYWLGGIRLSNGFVWITGEQMNYTNWDSRQPDNMNDAEDKMMLYNYSGARLGTWNDLSSEGMDDVIVAHGDMGFICEWDTDRTDPGEVQQTSWQGHRYQVFNNVRAWQDAEMYCEFLGGHLATISCQEENDFIYQLMIEAGYTSAYFGLTDRDEEGTWIWVTGEPVTYTNWHEGEPNSAHKNENYGMFYSSFRDGTWNDGDFEWGATGGGTAYICEWEPEEEPA